MISVIVPIHNTKNYVRECLDSILDQTYPDLEILCIDSSTDETTEIVKDLSKADPRIRHIIDPNGSYGYKLNLGIREAKGEYIGIIDSDDYIERDMYSRLLKVAEEYQADFVKADHSSFYTQDGQNVIFRYDDTLALMEWYGRVMSCEDVPEILYRNAISIWSGLYRTDFLRENRIEAHESPAASFQDAGFSVLTYLHAKRIVHIRESYYRYRTDNAGSSVKSAKKVDNIIDEFHWIDRQVAERGIASEKIQFALSVKKLDAYYWNYDRLDTETGMQFARMVRDELIDIFWNTGLIDEIPEDKKRRFYNLYYAGMERTEKMDISVIIPVYNTAEYLPECLDSVLSQNGVRTELICVNDGSTDDSRQVLEAYQQRDKRVIILDQKNAGLACARNAGIEKASGKYILFLDSDDMLRPHTLLELWVQAEEKQTDIIYFDAECLYETELLKELDNKDYYYQRPRSFGMRSGKNMLMELIEEVGNFCDSACLQLINREWMNRNQIRFIPGILYEDSPFSIDCMMRADRVFHINERYYLYRVRDRSIMTSRFSVKNLYGRLVGYDHLKELYCEEPMTVRQRRAFFTYMEAVRWSGKHVADVLSWDEKNKIFGYDLSWRQFMELTEFGFEKTDLMDNMDCSYLNQLLAGNQKIVLYGAGQRTKRFLAYILMNSLNIGELSVVVSKRAGNPELIANTKVYALDEGYEMSPEQLILVPLAGETGKKVVGQLKAEGYKNVIFLNDQVNASVHRRIKALLQI